MRIRVLHEAAAHVVSNVRPQELMLGVQERIAAQSGIPVDEQWLQLQTIEHKQSDSKKDEPTIVVKLDKKPTFAPGVLDDLVARGFFCALMAAGVQFARSQLGFEIPKVVMAILLATFLCGLPLLFTIVSMTQPNSVTQDLMKVADALFDQLTERQVSSLAMARFSADKLMRPLGSADGRSANDAGTSDARMQPFDTIVIGSGIGGCTAASIHAQAGNRVLLLEQNERFGGCTHSFTVGSKEHECEFDTGLHYVSSDMAYGSCRSGAIQAYVTRGHQKFVDLGSPYDIVTFREDDAYPRNDKCPNEFDYRFPSDRKQLIENILSNINSTPEARRILTPRLEVWFDIVKDAAHTMPLAWLLRLVPGFVRGFAQTQLTKARRMRVYGAMTTKDVQWAVLGLGWTQEQVLAARALPKAPEWRDVEANGGADLEPEEAQSLWPSVCRIAAVVTHPIGDYACQPRDSSMLAHALTANYYMNGAAYTVGHTQGISTAVLRAVFGAGGQAFCRATVERILVDDAGRAIGVSVRQTGSKHDPTDIYVRSPEHFPTKCARPGHGDVVCATSIYNLYHKLLPETTCARQIKRFRDTYTAEPSYGHTYLFVRLAKDVQTTAINTWYFGDYDLDRAFDEYFAEPEKHKPPTVYIGFPSMKDVTWRERYPGCKSALLIADAKWGWFKEWAGTKSGARGESYEAFKEKLSQRLLEVLYSKVPGTKDNVTDYWLGTPLTDSGYLGSFQGGSYGTRCNVRYFAENNLKYIMRSDTEFPGLHLAGSDAFCPAVAGAQYGGLLCGLNSISLLQRLSVGREVLMHQTEAIQRVRGCSLARAFVLAMGSNLDLIPKVKPKQKNLRPFPPFCTDDPKDANLFLQK